MNEPTTIPQSAAGGTHIEAEGFSVFYRAHEAVRQVGIRVARGLVTAIIGPSGCGKSTFLRAINRMNDLIPGCRIAGALRFVVAVMKINNDLERIADILANIADRGCRLEKYRETDLMDLIRRMGALATEMLRQSLECLLSLDVVKAVEVIKRDDELDALNVQVIEAVIPRAEQTTDNAGALFLCHSMARDIERIGDHATNIAEDVAYLVDGQIIRHGNNNYVTGGEHAKAANPRR